MSMVGPWVRSVQFTIGSWLGFWHMPMVTRGFINESLSGPQREFFPQSHFVFFSVELLQSTVPGDYCSLVLKIHKKIQILRYKSFGRARWEKQRNQFLLTISSEFQLRLIPTWIFLVDFFSPHHPWHPWRPIIPSALCRGNGLLNSIP